MILIGNNDFYSFHVPGILIPTYCMEINSLHGTKVGDLIRKVFTVHNL